jgi:RimJ/RimL family protein N-acetyltransferase
VDRSRWGEGFATEGGAAALAHAFGPLGAERVISVIEPPNTASIRVAEKLGERFEREQELQGKQVRVYGIDRERWLAQPT